jgi:hypothetical protein
MIENGYRHFWQWLCIAEAVSEPHPDLL